MSRRGSWPRPSGEPGSVGGWTWFLAATGSHGHLDKKCLTWDRASNGGPSFSTDNEQSKKLMKIKSNCVFFFNRQIFLGPILNSSWLKYIHFQIFSSKIRTQIAEIWADRANPIPLPRHLWIIESDSYNLYALDAVWSISCFYQFKPIWIYF